MTKARDHHPREHLLLHLFPLCQEPGPGDPAVRVELHRHSVAPACHLDDHFQDDDAASRILLTYYVGAGGSPKRLYNSSMTPNGARFASRILPSSISPFEDPRADQDRCHSSSSSRQCRRHQTPKSKKCKIYIVKYFAITQMLKCSK